MFSYDQLMILGYNLSFLCHIINQNQLCFLKTKHVFHSEVHRYLLSFNCNQFVTHRVSFIKYFQKAIFLAYIVFLYAVMKGVDLNTDVFVSFLCKL